MNTKMTKKHRQLLLDRAKARRVIYDNFHIDQKYHDEMIDLISGIIASANLLDRFVNAFDTFTEKALATPELRKIAKSQLDNSDKLLGMFERDQKNGGLFAQTDEQFVNMSTYSKYMEQVVRLSTDMDSEEKLIKAVATMRLIANSK